MSSKRRSGICLQPLRRFGIAGKRSKILFLNWGGEETVIPHRDNLGFGVGRFSGRTRCSAGTIAALFAGGVGAHGQIPLDAAAVKSLKENLQVAPVSNLEIEVDLVQSLDLGILPLAGGGSQSGGRGPRLVDLYTGIQPSGNFFWRYTSGGAGIAHWSLDDGIMGPSGTAAGGGHITQYEFAYGIYAASPSDQIRPAVLVSFYHAPPNPVGEAANPVVHSAEAASSVLWVFDVPTISAFPAFGQARSGLLDLAGAGLDFTLDESFYVEILPLNWPNYPSGAPAVSGRVHAIYAGPSMVSYGSNADVMWSDVAIRTAACTGPNPTNANGLYEHPAEMDACHFAPFSNRSAMRLVGDPCPTPNALRIDLASPTDACVKPGDPVAWTLSQACVPGYLRGYQAFLAFDATRLVFDTGAYALPVPYGLPIITPIAASGGTIDLSAGINDGLGQSPNSSSAQLATLSFTAGLNEGFAQLTFRANDPPSRFSDSIGGAVVPTLVDSPTVCVDGTPPIVVAPPATSLSCSQPLPPPAADYAAFVLLGGSAVDNSPCYGPMTPTIEYGGDAFAGGTGCVGDPRITLRTYRAIDCAGNSAEATQSIQQFDDASPTVTAGPDLSLPADAGGCTAQVIWPAAAALDACAGDLSAVVVYEIDLDNDGSVDATISATTFVFPAGTHRVAARADDPCGHVGRDEFLVTVQPFNLILVAVQLQGGFSGSRCITFELWRCAPPETPTEINAEIAFTDGLAMGVPLEVPCGTYACMTARDRLHSLRRTDDTLDISGLYCLADFTGANQLEGGNLNDDSNIDIVDFGIYMSQYLSLYGSGNTDCATPSFHGDISGNGFVFTEDFTFIQINFSHSSEDNCCGVGGVMGGGIGTQDRRTSSPLQAVAVSHLADMGLAGLAVADLDQNGVLDAADVSAFLAGYRPRAISRVAEPKGP